MDDTTTAIAVTEAVQTSRWMAEAQDLLAIHPRMGGCLLFLLYSLCLSLCIPTTLLELSGIVVYGWYAFPFYVAAKYFVVIVVVPLVFSKKYAWGRCMLDCIERGINRFGILQFFKLEVDDYPFRTSLLIRCITVPVSIQNYFLRSVSCPLKYSVLALTLASVPMTASHCYAMITISEIVGSNKDHSNSDSLNPVHAILKLVAILGASAVPGYFVKRYMQYKKDHTPLAGDIEKAFDLPSMELHIEEEIIRN